MDADSLWLLLKEAIQTASEQHIPYSIEEDLLLFETVLVRRTQFERPSAP